MDSFKAYLCSFLSLVVYLPEKKVPLENIIPFYDKGTDTDGFSYIHKDTHYIVFRGTEKKYADWKIDFSVFKTRRDYGKVHVGFYKAYDSVKDQIGDFRRNKVIFTGHSLGGALAQVAAIERSNLNPWINIQVYTYGSPRVFNKKGAASFNKEIKDCFHFVANNDIVPRVPFMNFWRTKFLYYINSKGKIQSESTFGSRMWDRVIGMKLLDGKIDQLSDHSMEKYYHYMMESLD